MNLCSSFTLDIWLHRSARNSIVTSARACSCSSSSSLFVSSSLCSLWYWQTWKTVEIRGRPTDNGKNNNFNKTFLESAVDLSTCNCCLLLYKSEKSASDHLYSKMIDSGADEERTCMTSAAPPLLACVKSLQHRKRLNQHVLLLMKDNRKVLCLTEVLTHDVTNKLPHRLSRPIRSSYRKQKH